MKIALKKYQIYIFAAILTLVGLGIPFIVLVITLNVDNAQPAYYPAILGAFAAFYLLVGFIWGDLHIVSYRRKNKNWDDQVPDGVKVEAWIRRLPFYISCLIIFVVFMVFEIIFWVTGNYPFL